MSYISRCACQAAIRGSGASTLLLQSPAGEIIGQLIMLHDMQESSISKHCVSKWVFVANLVVDVDQLMLFYDSAWQSLPSEASLPSFQRRSVKARTVSRN